MPQNKMTDLESSVEQEQRKSKYYNENAKTQFMNMQKTARQGDKDLIKEHPPKTEAHQHHQHNQHSSNQHNPHNTIAQPAQQLHPELTGDLVLIKGLGTYQK
jgi:hypothetical protein